MKRSKLLAALCLVGLLGSMVPAGRAANATVEHAYVLNDLDLFQGTDSGFELDKRPTRVEGMTMFVRLLGGEEEAKTSGYAHPFEDVPGWGDPYVGYAWKHGLTKGVSVSSFGSTAYITLEEYVTFVLRALGYDDRQGDFAWNTSVDKAVEIGLLTRDEATRFLGEATTRGNMVDVSYAALTQPFKDGSRTLAEKLVEDKVFTRELAVQKGLISVPAVTATPSVAPTASAVPTATPTPTPTPTPLPTTTPAPAPKTGWMVLIDYVKTVDVGRVYNAIVEGKVAQVISSDKRPQTTPGVYHYTLDNDLYSLSDNTQNTVLTGKVTLIDDKTIVIDGTEAQITKATITALLDGKDTELDVTVSKGDRVCLVMDKDQNAAGIFILEVYEDPAVPETGWLFLIDYVRTVSGNRVYNAIVGGELVQITSNDRTPRDTPAAYGYAMDGSLYALDAKPYDHSLTWVGEVTLIDRKSIIVDNGGVGMEAKITNSTVTALIDGKDTELDVHVSRGDIVCLISNENKEAEGIFTLAEYDDTASSIVAVRDSRVRRTGGAYYISSVGASNGEDIKELFVPSGGSDVYWFSAGTVTAGSSTVAEIRNAPESNSARAGTYQLVVVSEAAGEEDSTGYTVYPVVIER